MRGGGLAGVPHEILLTNNSGAWCSGAGAKSQSGKTSLLWKVLGSALDFKQLW